MTSLYFPVDELTSPNINQELAADFVELSAFFSRNGEALLSDLINASEIGAETEYADIDQEMREREEIVEIAVTTIERRLRHLGASYPFQIEDGGLVLSTSAAPTLGGVCYLLCLVLSHLRSVSPLLDHSDLHPEDAEVNELRRFFQLFATAAMAGEVSGRAWSFGFPRPDGTGFFEKLKEIWQVLKDGTPNDTGSPGAPKKPKDDQLDVIAAKVHQDGLPGFLCACAQVATGDNWKTKSARDHVDRVFFRRWFGVLPVTGMLTYHVIPFARSADDFCDDCLVLGNVLHRDRVPLRVDEAAGLHRMGVEIESFSDLDAARAWMGAYRRRGWE